MNIIESVSKNTVTEVTKDDLHYYMEGNCERLAVSLSNITGLPLMAYIGSYWNKYINKIDHYLIHAWVHTPHGELDIKGLRSLSDIKNDFAKEIKEDNGEIGTYQSLIDYGIYIDSLLQHLSEADSRSQKLALMFAIKYNLPLVTMSSSQLHESVDGSYYHVTFTSRIPKILQDGIQPGKKRNWDSMMGGKQGHLGYIYLFTSAESAARWAFKMEYDMERPVSIIVLKGVEAALEDDPSIESQLMVNGSGTWKRTQAIIPPSCIERVVPMSRDITLQLVAIRDLQSPTLDF